jgi:hypothetical protein
MQNMPSLYLQPVSRTHLPSNYVSQQLLLLAFHVFFDLQQYSNRVFWASLDVSA